MKREIRQYQVSEMPIGHGFINLTGMRFGRFMVMSFWGAANHKRTRYWNVVCDCGSRTVVAAHSMKGGNSRSCGCLRRELRIERNTTHGEGRRNERTNEFTAYLAAKRRCLNPNCRAFKDYGGRGIEFRFNSYQEFLAEVGRKPTSLHTLDRINNDGHYEKGNLRWATRAEQARNRRPSN